MLTLAVLAIVGLWAWYGYHYQGLYIDLHPNAPVTARFKTEGKTLYRRDEDEAWEAFHVRGVALSSSYPGFHPNEHYPDEGMYFRWMEQIGDLGANTIRVYTVMDDAFYNALYRYNTGGHSPLYLLQSVRVTDRMNDSAGDAYETGFADVLIHDAKRAVDVIHGNTRIIPNSLHGSGTYRRDVSEWVMGYIVGHEWNSSTIAYTDHRGHPTIYEGEYIRAGEGASAFEALLARVMDQIIGYESKKYKTQRLISFINDPQHDPFAYEQQYAKRVAKFSQLDIEHIEGTDKLSSGLFAAYRAYPFIPDFWSYLSGEQLLKLGDIPRRVDKGLFYEGYTQLLAEYHRMPVLIVSYSYSSSRGLDSLRFGDRLDERRQGELLAQTYRDIMISGAGGAVISGFADHWGQHTWNTSYAVEKEGAQMWHDLQTVAQGNGLIAYEPDAGRAAVVDGDLREWNGETPVTESDGMKLYARGDAEGLYLGITGPALADRPLYVSFDVTPKSGSAAFPDAQLRFDRPVDFLLLLRAGEGESRLMVQERYEALRANFLFETQRQDAYIAAPAADSPVFVPILSVIKPLGMPEETVEGEEPPPQYETFETGLLAPGNADPNSVDFNSQADYAYGPEAVEVRIPWGMLNFSDPSRVMVHDDYYEHYGVRSMDIKEIYIGFAREGETARSGVFPLSGWERVAVKERKKQSYFIVRQAWKEEGWIN